MGATIAGAECYNSDGAGRGVKNNGVYTPANEYQQAGIHADVKNYIVMSQSVIVKVLNYLKNYFSLSDYVERQSDIEAVIRSGVSFRGTNIFILIMAIFVASLGLNTNSTAVIIGAMLISPLMGPIIAMGLAIGIHDFDLLKTGLRNLGMATLISVITSTIFFLISPVGEGHSELLARTSPTIYDVLIALFGGGAGIIGLASRSKGNVVPGVAIATALMPPLCTAGYGIATGQPTYFLGAAYLFLINSIFIALATFVGVKLLRFKAAPVVDAQRARRVSRVVYAVAILTLVPSVFLTYTMLQKSHFEIEAQKFVNAECRFPATQVVSWKAERMAGNNKSIDITLIGRIMPEDSLVKALEEKLRYYKLEGTQINIIQGDNPMAWQHAARVTNVAEIYAMAQQNYDRSQATIDSLRACLSKAERVDTMAQSVLPEVRVVFPQVSELAVSPMIVCNAETGKTDTVTMAVVSYASRVAYAEQIELRKYLSVRLRSPHLRLVPAY